MKRVAVALATALVFVIAVAPPALEARGPIPPHVPDELLVRFRPGVAPGDVAAVHSEVGAEVVKRFSLIPDLELIRLPAGMTVKEGIARYRRHSAVLYAEPNQVLGTHRFPGAMFFFDDQWALRNTGQLGGTPGADIDATGAWDITTGSLDVAVGIIDTGVDYHHPDLQPNMFRNALECGATSGVDDDGNGVADDCFGVNTLTGAPDPMDDDGHGTHIAGIIGARGDVGNGVVGVNWNVTLLPCKSHDATGNATAASVIACLGYVKAMKDRGLHVVATNNSWGGPPEAPAFSQALFDAIDAHRRAGILFVAAAGNEASDNDREPVYPADYDLPNVIAVAATDTADALASFSNVGRRTVHLGAPGVDVLSTLPGGDWAYGSGTLMAAPHVTGVAALLKAQAPSRDWRAIKNLILAGGEDVPALFGTITGKRLNAQRSLTCAGSTVRSRLRPVGATAVTAVGVPLDLSVLHITCADPAGNVAVTVSPGDEVVTLRDDGQGADLEAGDGVYSARWIPARPGIYTLAFPDGDVLSVQALAPYVVAPATFDRRVGLQDTSLNLFSGSFADIVPPFPVRFGGGSFTTLSVSANGTVHFTLPVANALNESLPTARAGAVIAPFWDSLLAGGFASPSNVFWAVRGSAPSRELVVEWRDLRHASCPGNSAAITFQVVLFEATSDVVVHYTDTTFGNGCTFADRGGSATVGVQVSPGAATQWSFDTPAVAGGTALRWRTASFLFVGTSGSGRVTSDTGGIDCGPTCMGTYAPDTVVTLTAMPASGFRFSHWSGACGGPGPCTVTMSETGSVTATFIQAPDLAVTSVKVAPTAAVPGAPVRLTVTLRNGGPLTAPPSVIRYSLSLDGVRMAAGGAVVRVQSLAPLPPGRSVTWTTTLTVPRAVAAGSYVVVACADHDGRVAEGDETNNCLASSTRIRIGGPELIVTDVAPQSATVSAGGSMRVTTTVENVGGAAAGASTTRYYASPTGARDGSAHRLRGSRTVAALAPGRSASHPVAVTVPATTPAGAYFIVACADDLLRVAESDETDNCRSSPAQIQVTAR